MRTGARDAVLESSERVGRFDHVRIVFRPVPAGLLRRGDIQCEHPDRHADSGSHNLNADTGVRPSWALKNCSIVLLYAIQVIPRAASSKPAALAARRCGCKRSRLRIIASDARWGNSRPWRAKTPGRGSQALPPTLRRIQIHQSRRGLIAEAQAGTLRARVVRTRRAGTLCDIGSRHRLEE
jgi:hypothetical protein